MLRRLYLNNFYRHQDATFTFEKGLTGIIGPNESGKSLILEGIRYALFGSAALRASAPKGLHVELDFEVRGTLYTVVRKGANARLGDLAVGVKPVNEAIIKLLGYDLQVFDTANSCNQGEVEALSGMRPAERKAMVDRTVGLDVLDATMKYCGERGNALKSQAMGLRSAMVEPVEPIQPEGYDATATADLVRELNQLRGFLQSVPSEPLAPKGRGAEELKPLRRAAAEDVTEFNQLTGYLAKAPAMPVAPEVVVTDDNLEEHEAARLAQLRKVSGWQREMDGLVSSPYGDQELDDLDTQWGQYDLWVQREKLLAQGHICCPACNHSWPVAGNVPEAVETERPSFSRPEIAKARGLVNNDLRRLELLWQINDEQMLADRSPELRALAQWRAYEQALEAYQAYNEGIDAKRARQVELAGCQALIESLDAEYRLALQWASYEAGEDARVRVAALAGVEEAYRITRAHDEAVTRYATALVQQQALQQQHQELVSRSEDYLGARMAMSELKSRVKTHLLPSLNKVASHLLNQMTGGVRSSVVVDEDFDIKIDGEPVNTLSGSGKAVANLSIRIALGQILTNRVFSLFMADEIDGSMDEDRADYVAQCLRRLTGLVTQVILITHKRPEVDNMIELKKC